MGADEVGTGCDRSSGPPRAPYNARPGPRPERVTGGGRGGRGYRGRVPEDPTPVSNRATRLVTHERNPKWRPLPLMIDMSICINCDTCIRHCPPQFGAIFNHGID